jgi:hypothetical protein
MAIVVPVLNDWAALAMLLSELPLSGDLGQRPHLVVVDDRSEESSPQFIAPPPGYSMEVVRLKANLGHQRAIAIALVAVQSRGEFDSVIVMDGDGEDVPAGLIELVRVHREAPDAVVVAQRAQRSETIKFRLFYRLYKFLFRVLTGSKLDFGNFALLPKSVLCEIIYSPDLWNHFPVTLLETRHPLIRVPFARGFRYEGQSRMNFLALVNHGFAGVSVLMSRVFVRLSVAAVTFGGALVVLIGAGIVVRFTTQVPIPGWLALGTTAAVIILFQLLSTLAVVGFISVSRRSTYQEPPVFFASDYVESITLKE